MPSFSNSLCRTSLIMLSTFEHVSHLYFSKNPSFQLVCVSVKIFWEVEHQRISDIKGTEGSQIAGSIGWLQAATIMCPGRPSLLLSVRTPSLERRQPSFWECSVDQGDPSYSAESQLCWTTLAMVPGVIRNRACSMR